MSWGKFIATAGLFGAYGTTDRTLTLWINSGYEFPGDKHIHKKFLRNAQN